ncbi:MAG: transposase [Planctomycetaceae bacterium]|nr:integrase core domain-containing protein [Planctomycetales bacterium]MCB9922214.1 transposase [Planctomycetaceae bacterium]MCB9922309.1 transposase [Planctomycetaceae bacterium]
MREIFQPLLFLLARSSEEELRRQNEFLKAENELLRKRVPKKRIFLNQEERERLMKLGLAMGPAIRHAITIVDYSTFRRWVKKSDNKATATKVGRPRIAQVIRELVVQIANETGWGYSRILGELRKLHVGRISRQTVKNILVENGLEPGPKRGRGSWGEFLKLHADTLWQCDFFSKRIWTMEGPRQVFALAFIHVATRRVFVSPSTLSANGEWMKQQATAFLEHIQSEQLECSIVMRDLDNAFSENFNSVFTDRGIAIKPVGPCAPNLNAFAERWIQSIQQEALDHFIIFGQQHFDHIVREYVKFYHECRPHQGIGNVLLPKPRGEPVDDLVDKTPIQLSEIKCERRLSGLLKHYYRAA